MKFPVKQFILILFVYFFTGCNKNDTITELEPDFIIEYKLQCGWCAGLEEIKITLSKIEYLRHIPCGENEGTVQKERPLSIEEWTLISSSFNFNTFKTLTYSECNVCVDGCDEVIEITRDSKTHKISYSPNTKIKEIQEFQELLSNLMTEMSAMD